MSVSARVRAPVSYREWLAQVDTALHKADQDDAGRYYNFKQAYIDNMTPEQAVNDCLCWLYSEESQD